MPLGSRTVETQVLVEVGGVAFRTVEGKEHLADTLVPQFIGYAGVEV